MWDESVASDCLGMIRKMKSAAEEELQTLTLARNRIERMDTSQEDKGLSAIRASLVKTIRKLRLQEERLERLEKKLASASETFIQAEKRISDMSNDLMYNSSVRSVLYTAAGEAISVSAFDSHFSAYTVTPQWLSGMAISEN